LTPEEQLFLATLRAVDRGACARWIKAQGVPVDDAQQLEAAKERWRAAPILASDTLQGFARRVLSASAGVPVSGTTPFRATCWRGKFDVGDPERCVNCGAVRQEHAGRDCRGFKGQEPGLDVETTLGEFVDWLRERAGVVAEKGSGVVCCPTVSRDGRRINESTLAMTAVNLDCDGRGDWTSLLAELDALGIAYIAYQSGGWSTTAHKWHILIPLSRHFDTSTPEKITLWKSVYNACRVVFGSLANLRGEGFDPTIETPCTPVFVTERRKESDPPRQVAWRPGRALDADLFASAVPAASEELLSIERAPRNTEADPLEDARVEEIIAGLCEPVSRYLSDRRELYLALPGALLDRGVVPDDVLTICEEVSFRCPGDPRYSRQDVAKRHREHVHCAETTIARFERDGSYTRIGTLASRWPDVARAIDRLLPDPELDEMRARIIAATTRARAAQQPTVTVQPKFLEPVAVAPPRSPVAQPETLRRHLKALARRKLKSEAAEDQILGVVLDALVKREGEDLTPRLEDGSLVRDARGQFIDRDAAVSMAARSAAYKLPPGTLYEDVAEIFRPALFASLRAGESLSTLARYAEREFTRAADDKVRKDQERDQQRAAAGDRLQAAMNALGEDAA
jgi:hypothetical protein